jgi:SOS-response transcriptional repressor LexA
MEQTNVSKNKAIRGYILRSLGRVTNQTILVRQISNALQADGLIISPEISQHIEYLREKGYIEICNAKTKTYNVFRDDGAIRLTAKGVDLLEGTIDDPGVDV